MSESFSPLNRFFAVSEMKAFDRKESDHFISNQMSRVEMSIEQEALATIHEMSEGHPYVLVATCFVLFNGMTETAVKMTKNDVDEGRDEVLRALGQDFFSAMYHPLTPKAKDVLELILDKCEQKTFAFADVTEWTGWPKNTISPYMLELTRKGILNKHSRGQYEFFHGLFMEYIRRMDD
jgi:Holliday junction resolvasome RuvABC ATP-dependent DNA helicase subunit